ncbi:MAG: hypothetical protein ABIW19_08495 [Vicinamibacterales bacterium]
MNRRQLTGSFEVGDVVGLLFERWQQEPRIPAFFRDALRDRGPAAIADLGVRVGVPWDASLLEPILNLIERTSTKRGPRPWDDEVTINRGLAYLDRNYMKWRDTGPVAPRLSAAVRRFSPTPKPGDMYGWADMIALTHDSAMIPMLRGYLTDSSVDRFTSVSSNMPSGVTPMRYSELAANAICRLLGEPIMFSPWQRAAAPSGGPYPEWAEWDQKIAVLQQRLDTLRR